MVTFVIACVNDKWAVMLVALPTGVARGIKPRAGLSFISACNGAFVVLIAEVAAFCDDVPSCRLGADSLGYVVSFLDNDRDFG